VRIFCDFILALLTEWKVWLTDSVAVVVIAVVAMVRPDIIPLPFWLWFALVFGAGLLVAAFRSYRTARQAQLDAEKKLIPKIKVSFGENIPGCVVPTSLRTGETQAKWVRLKVEADSVGLIPDCSVTLTGLSRNNVVIFEGENFALNMARADATASHKKDLRDQVPEYADIIGITEHNQIFITLPPSGSGLPNSIKNQNQMFEPSGHYIFNMIISAPTTRSIRQSIRMHWGGDWRTVRFYSI
jgi:hypothetical protein